MGPPRNAPCPCGSGKKAKSCCGPVLEGAPAATPEALMRSRYTAYATGAVQHLMVTTALSSPHRSSDPAWRADLAAYCAATTFLGLEVLGSGVDGESGWVSFHARLTVDGQDRSFGERSTFVREEGRWVYVSGRPSD